MECVPVYLTFHLNLGFESQRIRLVNPCPVLNPGCDILGRLRGTKKIISFQQPYFPLISGHKYRSSVRVIDSKAIKKKKFKNDQKIMRNGKWYDNHEYILRRRRLFRESKRLGWISYLSAIYSTNNKFDFLLKCAQFLIQIFPKLRFEYGYIDLVYNSKCGYPFTLRPERAPSRNILIPFCYRVSFVLVYKSALVRSMMTKRNSFENRYHNHSVGVWSSEYDFIQTNISLAVTNSK